MKAAKEVSHRLPCNLCSCFCNLRSRPLLAIKNTTHLRCFHSEWNGYFHSQIYLVVFNANYVSWTILLIWAELLNVIITFSVLLSKTIVVDCSRWLSFYALTIENGHNSKNFHTEHFTLDMILTWWNFCNNSVSLLHSCCKYRINVTFPAVLQVSFEGYVTFT